MALDGAFLRHIKKEIEDNAINSRVDKIYQPSKDELILFLRSKNNIKKLFISSRGNNSARIHFTKYVPENPKVPPMLCMLFRKKLCGAKLISVRQPSLERVLFLDFSAKTELAEPIKLTLVVEIMGKYSNIILIDSEEKIIDAVKRVDIQMSSKRLILPGAKYSLPPAQNKISILSDKKEETINEILNSLGDGYFSKSLLKVVQGISPVVCREIEFSVFRHLDIPLKDLKSDDLVKIRDVLNNLFDIINNKTGVPFLVYDFNDKPLEFSFINIMQYENIGHIVRYETFSEVLDNFFYERDKLERMRVKSLDIIKTLNTISDRITRKISIQKSEIKNCSNFEQFKIYADIINSNLYHIKKGISSIELKNFYEDDMPIVEIKLDPLLTATQNSQKYYKEYKKSKTAISVLSDQIKNSEKELEYISTVLDELYRSNNEFELEEIRDELYLQGYLKTSKKKKNNKKLKPLEFLSSNGFKILVGRNNIQNDELTLKKSSKNDMWFHTKEIPGSHTVILTEGKKIPEETLLQAATIAAFHSKAKESSNVPVDYTEIRNVHKPNGSKPGMVIYDKYNTIYVTPDKELIKKLKVEFE